VKIFLCLFPDYSGKELGRDKYSAGKAKKAEKGFFCRSFRQQRGKGNCHCGGKDRSGTAAG
jgi:hypothetical protein